MFFSHKKLLPNILHDSQDQKVNNAWRLNIAFALIVIISISAVGVVSFRMIANSMLNHAELSSLELIKQTSKNLQTILTGLDDLAMTISRDNSIANRVGSHDTLADDHEKAENSRIIEEILNNYSRTRADIADIAILTNESSYIVSGYQRPHVNDDKSSYYAVRTFKEGDKKSLWLGTYVSDVNSTYARAENGQVFSIIKSIYSSSSLKSQGILLVNIKESYLYSLVSDIKSSNSGKIYIIGRDGNYVMNTENRKLNGQRAKFDFVDDMLKKKNGGDIREIDGREYLVTYNTVEDIKGTELKWTVVDVTPVSSITIGVTNAGRNLFFIGLGCVVLGFILSAFITRIYNKFIDKSYTEKHSIAMERERLASLGQLIGGIAHNFKTPIMSISGGLEAIKDLIEEYENSIGDPEVTPEDHHEIASEMIDWVGKIKPYCSYMSDIISTVKGQAANLNESTSLRFTVAELIKRVEILMSHELKRNKCDMCIDLKINENTQIKGEINNLVQVANNLISNSIESYNGEGGKIDLIIGKKGNSVEIIVRDFGCGITENVKNKLLREMITTKGKNGTGLGLYMSYSTIKGKFGGVMSIESELNKGTSVIISIPC